MVFDASTLILLAKIELLDQVARLHVVVITPSVREECTRSHSPDARHIERLIEQGDVEVQSVIRSQAEIDRLRLDFRIAEGEASSLVLARQLRTPVATDDRPAIKAAKVLSVPFATAIHFLIDLYRRGEMPRELALAKLEKLQRFGRYHPRIVEDAKRQLEGGPSSCRS